MALTKKQIEKLKASINPIEVVSYRILEENSSSSVEQFLIELTTRVNGLENARLDIVYDYGEGSDKYDIHLELTGKRKRTKEEIEEELGQMILREENRLAAQKKIKEEKLEQDRKVYERLKKKFDNKVTE